MTAKMPVRNSIRRSWERSQASLVDSTAPRRREVEILEPVWDDARLAAALTESGRAHANLATVGCVAQPSEQAETYAVRALTIAQGLQRRDTEVQALCYLGAITPACSDSRVETRVSCYVNAAGGRLPQRPTGRSRAVRRCWSARRGRAHRSTGGTLRLSAARRSRGRAAR